MISSACPGLLVEVLNKDEIPAPVNADSWENFKVPELKRQPKLSDFLEDSVMKGRNTAPTNNGEVIAEDSEEISDAEATKLWTESALHEPGFYVYDEETHIRVLYEGLNERGDREKSLKENSQEKQSCEFYLKHIEEFLDAALEGYETPLNRQKVRSFFF